MLNPFFAKICINIDVYFCINKDHGKRYFLCLLLYIMKFALESQVNIESNKD